MAFSLDALDWSLGFDWHFGERDKLLAWDDNFGLEGSLDPHSR